MSKYDPEANPDAYYDALDVRYEQVRQRSCCADCEHCCPAWVDELAVERTLEHVTRLLCASVMTNTTGYAWAKNALTALVSHHRYCDKACDMVGDDDKASDCDWFAPLPECWEV